jgi:hypothetical protein
MSKEFSDKIANFRKEKLPSLLNQYNEGVIYLQINQQGHDYFPTRKTLLDAHPDAFDTSRFGNHHPPIDITEEHFKAREE